MFKTYPLPSSSVTAPFVLVLALALASACSDAPDPSLLALPGAGSVTLVIPSTQTSYGEKFSEPERIAELLAVLHGMRSDWQAVTEAAEIPHIEIVHRAQVNGADDILMMLWVAEDWIGVRDSQQEVTLRQQLDAVERRALLTALGF